MNKQSIGPGNEASLCKGTPLGNMNGPVYQKLLEAEEEGLWKRSGFLSMGALQGESAGRAPLQGTKATSRHVKEGRGNGASLSL